MNCKSWKYLFLLFVSCGGNPHFRSRSDYHFWEGKYPKLTVKLNKVGTDDFFICNTKEIQEENSKEKISQAKSKKECSLEIELVDENPDLVFLEKNIKVETSDGKEFFIKINFSRQYQLINYEVGIGKIYHLKSVSTDLPGADIKTDYKNKILYNTYVGENTIEIEY